MELQLLRCGERSHDALQAVFKLTRRKNGERAQRIRSRAYKADESLRLSLIENESGNGINTKVSPATDRWKGLPRDFVAAPHYSSLLKLTRRRRHELRMETRDRVFLSISDWVVRRVQDPLVEIDPVTVHGALLAEHKADRGPSENDAREPTVTSAASPSLFGYLPPGFPKGAGGAALVAAIVLLLAALGTAAILALLRGNKKAGSVTHVAPGGQEANGSLTNGGARQELEDDDKPAAWQQSGESDKAVRKPVPVVTSSLETQASPYKPIPQYSTALDQSDLPLPPTFGAIPTEKKFDSHLSSSDDDSLSPVAALPAPAEPIAALPAPAEPIAALPATADPSVTLPNDSHTDTVGHEAPPVEETNETIDGVMKGDSALEVAAVVAVLESATITELVESALQEEFTTGTTGTQKVDLVELESVEDSPTADEPVFAGGLPSASKSHEEEQLSEVGVGVEYMLIGESDSLSPVAHLPAPPEPIAALPARADVGVPVDSILVHKSVAHPPSEELFYGSSEKIDVPSGSAQEAVPVGSIPPFEGLQGGRAGSGTEVAEERFKEYAQVIEKVLPAVSVGAGVAALSSFSGEYLISRAVSSSPPFLLSGGLCVHGALEVVGALATAFLFREVIWAGPRQQLFDEIRNIKSHKELLQFLEEKNIFPQSWSH